jgi:hypothetical protein
MQHGTYPAECSDEKLTPCSSSDWAQCDKCYKLVCEVHDELFQIWHWDAVDVGPWDMICKRCLEICQDNGDIYLTQYEHTN